MTITLISHRLHLNKILLFLTLLTYCKVRSTTIPIPNLGKGKNVENSKIHLGAQTVAPTLHGPSASSSTLLAPANILGASKQSPTFSFDALPNDRLTTQLPPHVCSSVATSSIGQNNTFCGAPHIKDITHSNQIPSTTFRFCGRPHTISYPLFFQCPRNVKY